MSKKKETKGPFIKKSGYVLALVEFIDIQRLNGFSIYNNDIYILPRKPTNETEAILAIKLNIFQKILQNAYLNNEDNIVNCKCEYIQTLRNCQPLKNIDEIHTLYIKYSFIINRIVNHLIEEGWTDNYILINVEPKGYNELEKTYPAPILTIPGGRMEEIDNDDFEECAFREFYEETLIHIKNSNYLCLTKDLLKCSKNSTYNHFNKKKNKNKKNIKISWYYSIKLFNPKFVD